MSEIWVLKLFIRLDEERNSAFPRMGSGETKPGISMSILLVSTNMIYHCKGHTCGFPSAYGTIIISLFAKLCVT